MEIRVASAADREAIYRIRHEVYAAELGQHDTSDDGRLTDGLDASNVYLVAARGPVLLGFVSVTPPWAGRYSVDKYLDRSRWPALADAGGLFEVRVLTVRRRFRGTAAAGVLMYAALRWIVSRGGRMLVAIGRAEVLALYERAGLRALGCRFRSGAVTFELMAAPVGELWARTMRYAPLVPRLVTSWRLDVPMLPVPGPAAGDGCHHGGASFDAIGVSFDALERRDRIVVADVLDAWFPPAPGAVCALARDADWIARSSPPVDAAGLVSAIAAARSVPRDAVVVGAGSSDLVFRAFGRWLAPGSRVLLLDPTYGEYAHVVERVIGARADRFALSAADGWRLDVDRLASVLRGGRYDLAVLVNPNNPTGALADPNALREALLAAPASTRIWVDEAYLEYAGGSAPSLEGFAASRSNVTVVKSLSKVYALSGLRAAYLVTDPAVAADLRRWTPPWPVSLPAQVAAVRALADPEYYALRWKETASLRADLAGALRADLAGALRGLAEVTPSVANFVLLTLPRDGLSAPELAARCRTDGVFVRDLSALSPAFEGRTVRIAVRGPDENARIAAALRRHLVA
jgi:histidinol-phosphate/aromatic aminotransferase/cobyric acid decarboxylase-like protein